MKKFATLQQLEDYKDSAMFCICGKLMTGLHINHCKALIGIENELRGQGKLE